MKKTKMNQFRQQNPGQNHIFVYVKRLEPNLYYMIVQFLLKKTKGFYFQNK